MCWGLHWVITLIPHAGERSRREGEVDKNWSRVQTVIKPMRIAHTQRTETVPTASGRGIFGNRSNLLYIFRAGVAQLVEHLICNQVVAGSIPAAGTKH